MDNRLVVGLLFLAAVGLAIWYMVDASETSDEDKKEGMTFDHFNHTTQEHLELVPAIDDGQITDTVDTEIIESPEDVQELRDGVGEGLVGFGRFGSSFMA